MVRQVYTWEDLPRWLSHQKMGIFLLLYVHIGDYSTTLEALLHLELSDRKSNVFLWRTVRLSTEYCQQSLNLDRDPCSVKEDDRILGIINNMFIVTLHCMVDPLC